MFRNSRWNFGGWGQCDRPVGILMLLTTIRNMMIIFDQWSYHDNPLSLLILSVVAAMSFAWCVVKITSDRWGQSLLSSWFRGERIVFWWPNTNINRLLKNDRIRIQILFGFPKMTEYEYEYCSVSQKWPNTNTNIIRFSKNDWIQYEYYSVWKYWPNKNLNIIWF